MKRLTIYRTCRHNSVYGTLKRESAYQLFLRTKDLRKNMGAANLIIASHIPEAMNSAKIIQLAMDNNIRIISCPRLSRYHAGRCRAFKEMFLAHIKDSFSHYDHIILVSHNIIISELTNKGVAEGNYLCIEADSWKNIFDFSANRLTFPESQLKVTASNAISETQNQDKLLLNSLQLFAD